MGRWGKGQGSRSALQVNYNGKVFSGGEMGYVGVREAYETREVGQKCQQRAFMSMLLCVETLFETSCCHAPAPTPLSMSACMEARQRMSYHPINYLKPCQTKTMLPHGGRSSQRKTAWARQ